MTKVVLPWPPKELSPNARVHWAPKAKVTAQYKAVCMALLLVERRRLMGKRAFKLVFCPPDKRRRDKDNCIAAFKAGQDALSSIVRVDDHYFGVFYSFGDPIKGGAVIVEVTG